MKIFTARAVNRLTCYSPRSVELDNSRGNFYNEQKFFVEVHLSVTASPLEKLKEQITVGDVVIKSTGKTS